MTNRWRVSLVSCFLYASLSTIAVAQEPTYMDAGTHPGEGQFYARFLGGYSEYQENGGGEEINRAVLKLAYGIRATLALVLEADLVDQTAGGDEDRGLGRTTLQLKQRLFKKDIGPLNTWRTSVLAGVTMPGDVDGHSPEESFPRVSVVSTAILGRHGLNAEVGWKEFGSMPDRFAANASHLYRVYPKQYAVDTRGAWYTMVESLNEVTDDGDSRCDVALGLLYEARRWAWEISVRLPLTQEWPREYDHTVTMGVRLLP